MEAGLNASLELQCRETMEIRPKHVRAGFAAGLEASRLWKLEQNNMTKKGPFFGPQNVRKSRRAKLDLPSSCRNHACRTTAEQRQLSLLASCGFQDKPIGNYLPQTPKRQTLAPNSKPKFDLKNEAILVSPYETIEAASQNLQRSMNFFFARGNCGFPPLPRIEV